MTTCSNSFLSQNTITVKKGTQIEGLYVGESYLEQKRFSLHIGNAIFGSRNSGVQYLWFSKEGNACIGTFKRKNKKHAYRVRECAENGNYCNNLHMFNYKINDSFGDKGLSPYLHIEFYEIIEIIKMKQVFYFSFFFYLISRLSLSVMIFFLYSLNIGHNMLHISKYRLNISTYRPKKNRNTNYAKKYQR